MIIDPIIAVKVLCSLFWNQIMFDDNFASILSYSVRDQALFIAFVCLGISSFVTAVFKESQLYVDIILFDTHMCLAHRIR